MTISVGRREFITAVGSTAVAWPLAAPAQQAAMPVIGWLSGISPGVSEPMLAAFRKALEEAGFIEHRNVGIEYRWAEGKYDRLPALATVLVALPVALIVSAGGELVGIGGKSRDLGYSYRDDRRRRSSPGRPCG